ncbi:hypothetical protein BT96DRAFT_161024 [Gymnopus androsaceus JB14]|uniref:Uncharacterized protein n=1 Tax=Gymnopus androsaceus JB14 TaxID=1447944 RepID=A0A6A4HBK3_9AGAR|nr:hypothetical protein BT96DRAFT_161024 [Gymnopus androsaceus JB14]
MKSAEELRLDGDSSKAGYYLGSWKKSSGIFLVAFTHSSIVFLGSLFPWTASTEKSSFPDATVMQTSTFTRSRHHTQSSSHLLCRSRIALLRLLKVDRK